MINIGIAGADMRLVFSNRAYLAILSETHQKISTETGGIFLGCFEANTFYVVEAIDPGPASTFEIAYFEYDQKYTQHLINKTARLYESAHTLVGLWHRHPGSFDRFSNTDDGTNRKYARLNKFGAVSVLVNIDPAFRMTAYHVKDPLKYTRIKYEVGDEHIPAHIGKMKTIQAVTDSINGYYRQSADPGQPGLGDLIGAIQDKFTSYDPTSGAGVSGGTWDISGAGASTGTRSHTVTGAPTGAVASIATGGDAGQGRPQTDAKAAKDHIIDSILEDLNYIAETNGLTLAVGQSEKYIDVTQKGAPEKICFTYLPAEKKIIFSYCESLYLYEPGLFKRLLSESV